MHKLQSKGCHGHTSCISAVSIDIWICHVILVLGKGRNTSIMSAKSSKARFATVHASSSVLLSIWPCLYMHLACATLTLSRCTPSNIIHGIYTHFPNKCLVKQTCNGTSLDCYDKSDCMKINHRPIVWVPFWEYSFNVLQDSPGIRCLL